MRFKSMIAIGLCATMIVGCAGRKPERVAVIQDRDFSKSCEALHLEADSNDAQIKSLVAENASNNGKNAALAVVSIVVFLPALFALDLKGAAKAEYEALIQRSNHLANVAEKQGCNPIRVKTLDDYKKEIAAERKANHKNSGSTPSER